MPILIQCSCGKQLQAKEEHAGKRVKCPACGAVVDVPTARTAVEPAAGIAPPPSPRPAPPPQPALARRFEDEGEQALGPPGRTRGGGGTGISVKAIFSLVLGILSLFCSVFTCIPAVVLALLSFRDIGRSGGSLAGKGFAIAGIITGVVGTLCNLPILLIIPGMYFVQGAAANQVDRNNLTQLALAMHNHNDMYGQLPDPAIRDKDGKPLLSWRVKLLPFLEEDRLFREFKLDEPWDSPHNRPLLARMPKVYASPLSTTKEPTLTYYQLLVGGGAAFNDKIKSKIPGTFQDGTSNTILIAEIKHAVPWTKPEDVPYDPNQPLPDFGVGTGNDFKVALADASVRTLNRRKISEKTLRAAITANGGEVLGADW
jgi:hypothetical protein